MTDMKSVAFENRPLGSMLARDSGHSRMFPRLDDLQGFLHQQQRSRIVSPTATLDSFNEENISFEYE